MKSVLKKMISMMLIMVMSVTLLGCFQRGNGEGEGGVLSQMSNPEAAKEAVYKEVAYFKPDLEWIDNIYVSGENIYMVWSEYINEEDLNAGEAETEIMPLPEVNENGVMLPLTEAEEYAYYYKVYVGKTNYASASMSKTSFLLEKNESMSNMTMDPATGNLYIVTEYTVYDESNPDDYVVNTDYYMNVYSCDGEFINRQIIELGADNEEWYAVNSMIVAPNGNICIATEQDIYVYDSACNKVGVIEFGEYNYVNRLFVTGAGKLYAYVEDDGNMDYKMYFYPIDSENLVTDKAIDVPDHFGRNMRVGKENDIYYNNDKGVYVYNLDNAEEKLILDFVDSDIDYNYFDYCIPVDVEHLIGIVHEPETYECALSFLEKVPPEEVVERTIITIGMLYVDSNVRTEVINFNKTNQQYRIRIIEYYEYNTEADENAGIKMLNNDIVAESAPDIILLNEEMPIQSFMEKGVFLDLNPYMEADSEVKKEGMAQNILALGSYDGSTYFLTTGFSVATMVMKELLVPGGETISLDELRQAEMRLGNIKAMQYLSSQDVLYYAMDLNISEYLDVETGKCNFNTPSFCALLEYAGTYPREIDWDSMDEEYWMSSEYAFRQDKAMLRYEFFSGFDYFDYLEQGIYGEEIAFVGFPGNEEITGIIYPDIQMAISSRCECPDVAWEFMRRFYTYEYQTNNVYCIPTNLAALDDKLAEAQRKPYYTDENGEIVEYDETYWLMEEGIIIQPLTEERANELKEYVLSLEETNYYDDFIMNIIYEESASFFAGQKTAQQAADIIQNRVQIYVNENR